MHASNAFGLRILCTWLDRYTLVALRQGQHRVDHRRAPPSTGYYACDKAVQVGRPSTKEQLLDLIKAFPKVRGVGVGHSWVKEFFCAGNTTESIDIVLTELTDTKSL